MAPMRYFTVEEAQALVPQLEKIFALCAEIRSKAQARVESIKRLEGLPPGESAQLAIERSQVQFLAQCLEHALQGIDAMGALLKGLDPGLVDFPHRTSDGDEVLLCWQEGEKEITHFHGVDEGFAGRKPLPKHIVRH